MPKVILLLALLVAIAGCGSSTPEATADQAKTFKGGPMPESFKRQIEEQNKNAAAIAAKAREEKLKSGEK